MFKIILPIIFISSSVFAQGDQLTILNDVVSTLRGDVGDEKIKVYTTIREACDSDFVTCNRSGKIIGLDFQFANLCGYIPEKINQLKDLEYINLEYNYLKGKVPKGLNKMEKLEEVLFNGNFLEGPVPMDIQALSKRALVDLSKNSIKISGSILSQRGRIPFSRMNNVVSLYDGRVNLADQFNLEGCRSPDSIFVEMDNIPFDAVMPENRNKLKNAIDSVQGNSSKSDKENSGKAGFVNVDVMPRFPGCEDEGLSDGDKENCAKQKMLQFIYGNLRYPEYARVKGIQGMVVCQFVINEYGQITNAKVLRDIGGRCGNASLWIVNRMNFICEDWTPGFQYGEAVKVLYTLPVKFKLE